MMTRKPGPPVPPRPSAGLLLKTRSESPISQQRTNITAVTTTGNNKISSSADTGRTVIYKSPSFDLKKRQQQQEQQQQQQEYSEDIVINPTLQFHEQQQPQQQNYQNKYESNTDAVKQQSVFISEDSGQKLFRNINNRFAAIESQPSLSVETAAMKATHSRQVNNNNNGNVMIESKTNRTEIVIINNSKATIKTITSDNHNNNITMGIDINIPDRDHSSNGDSRDDDKNLKAVDKVSPVPKPRTLITSRAENNNRIPSGNTVINKSCSSRSDHYHDTTKTSETTIINDVIESSVKNNSKNIQNNSNNRRIDEKTFEIENNIKNTAERLFTEICINHSKQLNEESNVSRTEHCISVRSTPSPPSTISQNANKKNNPNLNRTCVNLSHRPEPEGGENKSSLTDTAIPMNNIQQRSLEDKLPAEKKVAFHEILISELAAMRNKNCGDAASSSEYDLSDHDHLDQQHDNQYNNSINSLAMQLQQQQQQKQQRKRYPSGCSTDSSPYGTHRSRIRTSDWVEVGDNGKEVMLTSCHISLEDSGLEDEERLDDTSSGVGDSWDSVKDAEERMSLPGLPPLPKSLSGLESSGVPVHNSTGSLASLESQRGISPISRMTTATGVGVATTATTTTSTLDTQLAVLRREMFGLRQLDLSLLSQLWALNESIQEFRTMLQEQETLSPPSPSPSPSDANSVSSDAEDDITPLALGKSQLPQSVLQRMRSAPPPPPPTRKAPQRPV